MVDVRLLSDFLPDTTPTVIPGRCLLVDGDFVAYFVSTGDETSLDEMKRNAEVCIENLKIAAQAESTQIHLTGKGSTKGDRFKIARLKQYQANRTSTQKPPLLHAVREFMRDELGAKLWMDLEADDGLSIAQHALQGSGVVVSKDKDLMIVPGYHLDWDTHVLFKTTFAGDIQLTPTGKVKGSGFKFFCAQMLMGDPVDGISGLPRIIINGKPMFCGPTRAYQALSGLSTPEQCLRKVLLEYRKTHAILPFKDYNGVQMTAEEAFESEARLLWLRRTTDPDDVLTVFKEVLNGETLY